MATGITASLQCDPLTKRETWLFQQVGMAGNVPLYRRLKYNLVSFDGDPTQYVEPDAATGDFIRVLDGTGSPLDPRVDGIGLVAGFQFCSARPFEMFSLDDVDVTNNLGQLP